MPVSPCNVNPGDATHVPGLTMAQAKQVADIGAVIEVCFLQFTADPNAPLAFLTHWTQINAKHVAQAVKETGGRSLVIPPISARAPTSHILTAWK